MRKRRCHKLKITGVDKLNRKLSRLPKAASAEIRKALDKSAAEIAATARNFSPFDTGALRNSIGYTFGQYVPENANVRGVTGGGRSRSDLSVTIHAGDATAYYARWVEFGTAQGQPPNPFFFPAYRLGKKRARGRISRSLTKAAKIVAGNGN